MYCFELISSERLHKLSYSFNRLLISRFQYSLVNLGLLISAGMLNIITGSSHVISGPKKYHFFLERVSYFSKKWVCQRSPHSEQSYSTIKLSVLPFMLMLFVFMFYHYSYTCLRFSFIHIKVIHITHYVSRTYRIG